MQGKNISGYTLQSKLGIGGMAEVWLAENAIGKKAAVKLLLPKFCQDESIVARFQNEAKVMVQLDHPNIRQVYDFGNIDGRPCIVMEYLEGNDLKALMKNGRHFTDAELRNWWNQIADALNYTHAQGVVHRDIKPSNIFLDKNGNIKLLDFGIAKIKESISMTQTGSMMGTLMYMSPEQVEDSKHIGPESDRYSLAVSFVHLLSGKAPYDSTTSGDYAIRKGIVEIPLDMAGVPAPWQSFLAPYLEKNPEKRPVLRSFDASSSVPAPTADDDDQTIVGDSVQHSAPVESPAPSVTTPDTILSTQSIPSGSKSKSKRRIWIPVVTGILILLVSVSVVLLIFLRKTDKSLDSNSFASQENEMMVATDTSDVSAEGESKALKVDGKSENGHSTLNKTSCLLGDGVTKTIVRWTFQIKDRNDKEFDLIVTADIADGWRIGAATSKPAICMLPSEFVFKNTEYYELVGSTRNLSSPKIEYDELFKENVSYFSGKASLAQTFRKKKEGRFPIAGVFSCQIVTDAGNSMAPEEIDVEMMY